MKGKSLKIIDHLHGVNYSVNQPRLSTDYEDESDYFHLDIPQTFSKVNLISGIITIYLLYYRFSDNLLVSWQSTCYVIYIAVIYNFINSFLHIINDSDKVNNIQKLFPDKEEFISKVENLMLLSNLVNLIHYTLCFFSIYFFAELMDSKDDKYIYFILTTLGGLTINQLIFSFLADSQWFNIKINKDANSHVSYTDSSAFLAGLITPIATYLSNLTMICSANSGVCTQFYLSTLTSILGAFGITVSNLSQYLFPITVVMLIVSNISLYIKRKKLTHPPFILGIIATLMIIISKINEGSLWMFLYIGNVLMLIAAVWNMKMNKFFGLPSRKK